MYLPAADKINIIQYKRVYFFIEQNDDNQIDIKKNVIFI